MPLDAEASGLMVLTQDGRVWRRLTEDGDEIDVTGTDPLDADTDDGGVEDGTEVDEGSDPNDPADDDGGGEDGEDCVFVPESGVCL